MCLKYHRPRIKRKKPKAAKYSSKITNHKSQNTPKFEANCVTQIRRGMNQTESTQEVKETHARI